VWVNLQPDDPQLSASIRRAMYLGAPAVLAVAAPRPPAIDEALAEQDLVALVTREPDGPLAHTAATGLAGARLVTTAPITRGPARTLACAGLRPTATIRRLVRGDARR
jgi:hypothetical protein